MRIVKDEPHLHTKAKRLTLKWYKTIINTYEVVCIAFYCEWCTGSGLGNFASEYDKAANIIANLYPRKRHEKGKAIMVKVNCSDEKVLAQMFNISNYPTYQIIKHGEIMDVSYPSWKDTETFLQMIERHIDDKKQRLFPEPDRSMIYIGLPTHKLTLADYKEFVKQYDAVLVLFYVFSHPPCREALIHLGEAFNMVCGWRPFEYSFQNKATLARMELIDKNVIKKFKIRKYPTFKLFRNGKRWGDYQWDGTTEGILSFLKKHLEEHLMAQSKKKQCDA